MCACVRSRRVRTLPEGPGRSIHHRDLPFKKLKRAFLSSREPGSAVEHAAPSKDCQYLSRLPPPLSLSLSAFLISFFSRATRQSWLPAAAGAVRRAARLSKETSSYAGPVATHSRPQRRRRIRKATNASRPLERPRRTSETRFYGPERYRRQGVRRGAAGCSCTRPPPRRTLLLNLSLLPLRRMADVL